MCHSERSEESEYINLRENVFFTRISCKRHYSVIDYKESPAIRS